MFSVFPTILAIISWPTGRCSSTPFREGILNAKSGWDFALRIDRLFFGRQLITFIGLLEWGIRTLHNSFLDWKSDRSAQEKLRKTQNWTWVKSSKKVGPQDGSQTKKKQRNNVQSTVHTILSSQCLKGQLHLNLRRYMALILGVFWITIFAGSYHDHTML